MVINLKILDRACLAAVLALSIAAAVTAATYVGRKRSEVRQERKTVARQEEQLHAAQESLKQLQTAVKAREDEFQKLNALIPENGDIGTFLENMDILSKQRNIELINMQPQAASRGPSCTRTPVRMSLAGNFADLHHFLYDLETMPRLIRIETLTVRRLSEGERCQAEMTVSLFEQ